MLSSLYNFLDNCAYKVLLFLLGVVIVFMKVFAWCRGLFRDPFFKDIKNVFNTPKFQKIIDNTYIRKVNKNYTRYASSPKAYSIQNTYSNIYYNPPVGNTVGDPFLEITKAIKINNLEDTVEITDEDIISAEEVDDAM